ncbi:MAG: hypothetical protein IPM84_21540 [Anaerolineae bacterium]|nr:hypothetical protein [Anaerolineae bacterium]
MMMNIMVFCIGALGYWLTGFALQFGAVNFTYPAVGAAAAWAHSPTTLGDMAGLLGTPLLRFGQVGLLGGSGFMLMGVGANVCVLSFFLFQMVFMDTAATIPTGSMAERLKFSGFVLMSLWISMFIYPLVGGWVWGGGWLQNLGRFAGLGNGAVDFAGSGVVHMIGALWRWWARSSSARASAASTRMAAPTPCRVTTFQWGFWARSSFSSAGLASTPAHRWPSWAQAACWRSTRRSTPCWPARPVA